MHYLDAVSGLEAVAFDRADRLTQFNIFAFRLHIYVYQLRIFAFKFHALVPQFDILAAV